MTDKPDLEDLARQYMDLWQEHLAGLAGDREVADIVARTIEMMNAGPAAVAAMAGMPGPAEAKEAQEQDDGAASAAAAPGVADPRYAELERRVAELERRLAAVEGSPDPGPGGGTDEG